MATKKATKPATKKAAGAKSAAMTERETKKRLYAILLFALGAMLLALAAVPGDRVWLSVHEFLLGCFSWCAYLLGPILIYTAVMVDLDKSTFPVGAKVSSCALLIVLLCAASQIFYKTVPEGTLWALMQQLYRLGIELKAGGVFGMIVGMPLLYWLDVTGAAITIIVLIFVALMIISGATIAGLLKKTFVRPVRRMEEAYMSAAEQRAYQEVTQRNSSREITDAGATAFVSEMKRKKPDREPTPAPPQGDRVLDALRAMDAPIAAKLPEGKKPSVADPANDRLFDFEAHAPAQAAEAVPAKAAEQKPAPRKKLNDPMEIFGEPAKSEKPEKPSDELTIDEIISRAVGPLTAQTTPPAKTDEVLKPLVETPSGMFCFDAPAEPPKAEPPKTEAQGKEPAKEPPQPAPEVPAILKPLYSFPPVSLLKESKQLPKGDTSKELKANADRLVDTLKSFGVQTRIVDISRGPAVTRYELQPSAGVKISRITNLADDIALNLAAAGVRIEAPIPNKAAIGIEVPNKIISTVPIRELLDSQLFRDAKSKLTVVLGRDITGELALADLGKMPHLLIAGATGSGKSVCINSLIVSLLFKANPDEVKLLMIDPKVVELGSYNGIPHLLSPVVTDPKKAAGALCTMVGEMLRRYKLFADHNVRDLSGYNKLAQDKQEFEPLPQIVIIIDELADLMMASPKDVEDYICRLAQMARAAGMHLVIATQRPSVDVITGVIKANIPSRISFAVSSQIDSRTILDMGGAEKLLGRGDMLYYPVGSPKPTRIQGCFVTDGEVEHVVEYIKNGSAADYDQTMMDEIDRNAAQVGGKGAGKNNAASGGGEDDTDALFTDAIQAVVEAGQASTSLLQRRLKVGYARAARLIDEMEQRGIVGPFEGSKPRQVLISKERFYEMKMTQSE